MSLRVCILHFHLLSNILFATEEEANTLDYFMDYKCHQPYKQHDNPSNPNWLRRDNKEDTQRDLCKTNKDC